MADRDLSDMLMQPAALPPTGRDMSSILPDAPTMQQKVTSAARAYAQWLPGGEVLQAAPALPSRMQLPGEELAPPLFAEAAGAVQTPGMLPAAGEAVGSAITPGLAKPLGGGVGAGAGALLEQIVQGEPIDVQKIGAEAAISALPEVLESVGRWGFRMLARGTEGGKQLRWSDAARRARESLPQVFQPKPRPEVIAQFEELRKMGVTVDPREMETLTQTLSPGKYDELLGEVRRIDRRLKTGGRYSDMLEASRSGTLADGPDIGDMQTLRSELRKRREELEPPEARQLLGDAQMDIDDAIDAALDRADQADFARQARRDYARLRSAEDMADFVETKITSSPDLTDVSLNLRSLSDELRRNRTRQAKQLNRSLRLTPGAEEAFLREVDTLSQRFRRIELPLADVSRGRRLWVVGMLGGWLSDIMLNPATRELFEQSVLEGRGRISPNTLAILANMARRDVQEGLE